MRAVILFLILLLGPLLAQAESYGPTEAEMAMLPPYCGGPGGKGMDWAAILGPARTWNNHTCYGINRINRYYRSSKQGERRYHLQTAMQDFNYSVGHLPQDFPLMPEILYYRGLVHKLQGNVSGAMSDWLKSISLNKRYVRSIVELADLYAQQMKKPDQALELVTEGLRDNPGVKALQNRYTRYGGKLPYPEPRIPAPAEQEKTESGTSVAEQSDAKPQDAKTETVRPGVTSTPQVTGTAKNPWCRFCPEPPPSQDPAASTP